MQLVSNQNYMNFEIDFFLNKQREIFITIEQLARGFGYKSRKGVERMLERNPYLRDSKFSVMAKVPHRTGGTQETRLFNKRGIFEIGMLSRTKQGKEFRQWLYDYLEYLEKENEQYKVQRTIERQYRKSLNDAVKEWTHHSTHSYIHINNLLLKNVTGKTASVLKTERGNASSALDLLSAEELARYRDAEQKVIALLEMNFEYEDIKKYLAHTKARKKENIVMR